MVISVGKTQLTAALLVSCLPAFGPVPAQAATVAVPGLAVPAAVRILPLGDSITAGAGSSTGSGYRAELWMRLAAGGYRIDFAGSQSSGQLPDPEHEGHGGWTISQLAAHADGWLAAAAPDIVLLHIGTNDVKTAAGAIGAAGRLRSLIGQIRAAAPGAVTVVAQIVPIMKAAANARVIQFNDAVRRIVTGFRSPQVRLADHFHALAASDFADWLHPHDGGYAKMAGIWFAAVTPLLGRGLIGTALNASCGPVTDAVTRP